MSGWAVLCDRVDRDVHVVPVDDLIDHALDDDCGCGATPEPVDRGDGADGWLWVHHSLDGRETGEAS